jgi:hypothetical protein
MKEGKASQERQSPANAEIDPRTRVTRVNTINYEILRAPMGEQS